MAYQFHNVDIGVFDFHITLDPLLAPASLTPAFAFLGNPDGYRQQFKAKPFLTGEYRVRPLSNKARTWHHFWKYYTAVFGELDPWSLLLPFVCEPTKTRLAVTSPAAGIKAFVRPATYLFPFGWSTTLEMSLAGDISAAQLRDFVGSIRANGAPFLLQGKAASLSDVLGRYGDEVKKACLVKGVNAPEFRRVDRHLIVSLAQFAGDIRYYKPRTAADPLMPAADKASLHEILRGEAVSQAEIVAPDADPTIKKDFLLTRFRDAGIAITYFKKGSLLFLPNKASLPEKRKAMRCLSTNLLLAMMMLHALLNVHDYPDIEEAAPDTTLGRTREAAKKRLLKIGEDYKNALCKTWFKHYPPLQKLQQPEKPESK